MMHDPSSQEPPVPTEPDDDTLSDEFARALAEFDHGAAPAREPRAGGIDVEVGAKVSGMVVAIGDEHAMIDFGGRSEAAAELRHWRADDGTLGIAVGDTLELFVVEAGDQVMLAPSIRAESHAALAQLREARASGVPVSGKVSGVNTGGLQVELSGVRGFCPVSQIEAGFCADPSVYVGRTLEFVVTEVKEGRGGVVLSRRALLRKAEEEQAKQMLAALKPGDERDGRVARLEPFGAFIDLGGVDGMVHVSEIRHERTTHPRDALKEGETVRVRVMRIEAGKDGRPRIALSIKACAPDPWEDAARRFPVGTRVKGVVARLAEFGAFVTLAPGLDGLVHVSQAALQRVQHVREVLTAGQEIEAVVLAVEPEKKRIALSIRQLLEADLPADARPAPPARDRERGQDRGRGFGGGGGGRGGSGGGRDRGDRPPRRENANWRADLPVAPAGPPEPTTMAIALRKAMEEAERKRAGKKPA